MSLKIQGRVTGRLIKDLVDVGNVSEYQGEREREGERERARDDAFREFISAAIVLYKHKNAQNIHV